MIDRERLARVCEMRERSFADAYDLRRFRVPQRAPDDFYLYRDNGSDVLAVAHLDTVVPAKQRRARYVETDAGTVIHSGALDDRLGAYILLDLLPDLGIRHDWLLTVGEESGRSTAAYFDPPKPYRYVIEFDRGPLDVVMYQYEDSDTRALVEESGARVGQGSFSDISYLEHLGVKCFNWGVGYRDYHGPRSHAYLDDTVEMVGHYLDFHDQNDGITLPHVGLSSDEDDWSDWQDRCEWCWTPWPGELAVADGESLSPELCPECLDYWDVGARNYSERYNLK